MYCIFVAYIYASSKSESQESTLYRDACINLVILLHIYIACIARVHEYADLISIQNFSCLLYNSMYYMQCLYSS